MQIRINVLSNMAADFNVRIVLAWLSLLLLFGVQEQHAIMSINEEGVYSLFPHEDLRTGRKIYSMNRERDHDSYREPERYRERPSSDPVLVPILRPSFPPGHRKLTNMYRYDDDTSRERDRNRGFYRFRSPRIFFRDDERRVYGFGKKYHAELPPILDDRSRETNLIRPSPVDYSRGLHRGSSEESDRRYLPNYGRPRPKQPTYVDSGEKTRIHVFTTENLDRFGHSRRPNGNQPADGPVKIDAPGPGAFLNHEEYLEFHTKLALETLDKERKKLEEARNIFGSKVTAGGSAATGLVPPNFSKEVMTVIEEIGDATNPMNDAGSNSNVKLNSKKPIKGSQNGSSNPSVMTPIEKVYEGGKSSQNSSKLPTTEETGFLPIVPFHLEGITEESPSVTPIDNTRDSTQSVGIVSSEKDDANLVTEETGTFPPDASLTTAYNFPVKNTLPVSPPISQTTFNVRVSKESTTTKTTTTARIGVDDIHKIKFQRDKGSTVVVPLESLEGNLNRSNNGSTNDEDDRIVQSPSVFIESGEVGNYLIFKNGTSVADDSLDRMVIYVQRIKSSGERRQYNSSASLSIQSHNSSSTQSGMNSSTSFVSTKQQSLQELHGSNGTTNNLKISKAGVNSGVVAKAHAHISRCPKLYGAVEIICDVNIRERHGEQNPQLIVGWLRKFYNESKPDVLLAVNKELAYIEDFHDKFNVTLAPGVSPMLRSVLMIREVTAEDCGNYECEVFDGVSIHRSETLVFLCH